MVRKKKNTKSRKGTKKRKKQRVEIEYVTDERANSYLSKPSLLLVMESGKIRDVMKKLVRKLPKPNSNAGRDPEEFIKLVLYMMISGYSTPESFIEHTPEHERKKYGIDMPVSTFYDWLDRVAAYEEEIRDILKQTADMVLQSTGKPHTGIHVDIDASYRKGVTEWTRRNYEGYPSYRLMFTHVSNKKSNDQAIYDVRVDPGNIAPQDGIPDFLQEVILQKQVALVRSDSAAYSHACINTCEQHDVAWVMGCKRDNAVLESIGQIEEDEYREYRNNKDVQTDARVAIAPHAMNQRKYGFYVVNKKVKKTGKKTVEGKTQQSLFELLEPQHVNLPVAVCSSIGNTHSPGAIRRLYEQRGSQEHAIGEFKMMNFTRAKATRQKTASWILLSAIVYNIALYLTRGRLRKKKQALPGPFEISSWLLWAA